MAPRSAARSPGQTTRTAKPAQPAALTDADVRTLQDQLAAGEKPRVALLRDSALGPAGTPGVVVTISEPAVGECVIVRVRGDDLPFAADELTWPVRKPRGRPRKDATEAKAPATAGQAPTPAAPARTPPPSPPPPPPTPTPVAAPAAPPRPAQPTEPTEVAAGPAPTPTPAAKKAPARRGRSAGAPAPFSVSLRFTGKGWTSESSRSGKRSKPQPVSLAAMRALAIRLDDVDLRNTIVASLDHCRREVEERAAALRAELEAAEIALAELEEDA